MKALSIDLPCDWPKREQANTRAVSKATGIAVKPAFKMSLFPHSDNEFFDKYSYRHDRVKNINHTFEPLPNDQMFNRIGIR